jgi:hypothetical protein
MIWNRGLSAAAIATPNLMASFCLPRTIKSQSFRDSHNLFVIYRRKFRD